MPAGADLITNISPGSWQFIDEFINIYQHGASAPDRLLKPRDWKPLSSTSTIPTHHYYSLQQSDLILLDCKLPRVRLFGAHS